jgi:hypothetical protein
MLGPSPQLAVERGGAADDPSKDWHMDHICIEDMDRWGRRAGTGAPNLVQNGERDLPLLMCCVLTACMRLCRPAFVRRPPIHLPARHLHAVSQGPVLPLGLWLVVQRGRRAHQDVGRQH